MRARYHGTGSEMRVSDITHSCTRLLTGPMRRGAARRGVPNPSPSLPPSHPQSRSLSLIHTHVYARARLLSRILSLPLSSHTNEIVRPCYRAGRFAGLASPVQEATTREIGMAEGADGGQRPPWRAPLRGAVRGEDHATRMRDLFFAFSRGSRAVAGSVGPVDR